jgi:hypothetical protein
MKKLDIVLLQCGLPELTVRCLESIHETFDDCRVILVDNGSSAEEIETAFTALDQRDDSFLICNGENLGFAKAMNIGLAASNAPYVCILNNDTIIAPDAFERMLAYMEFDPNLAIVGPLTNRCETAQRAEGPGGPGLIYTNGLVAFFCTIIRRTAWQEIGPLSEEYGLGYGEDDDYCIRTVQAGWRMGIARDAWVWHDHHATYRITIGEEGMEREGQQGLALLREKYGAISA